MESSKSDSESPDQAEFRGDNKCAQCMQVLYLQSEQVNGIHNLEDIHIQSSTSTATILSIVASVLSCRQVSEKSERSADSWILRSYAFVGSSHRALHLVLHSSAPHACVSGRFMLQSHGRRREPFLDGSWRKMATPLAREVSARAA